MKNRLLLKKLGEEQTLGEEASFGEKLQQLRWFLGFFNFDLGI